MIRPRNRSIAGLLRLLADPDTAVQVVSYTRSNGVEGDSFDAMRPGINYWPRWDLPHDTRTFHRADRTKPSGQIRFTNTTSTIALMWPQSWTYASEDDGNAVLAIRQNREGGDRLVLRLHQPEVLAARWSESINPDRIEE